MKTLHFKTNINCGGCIAAVSPELNSKDKIQDWSVDTISTNKTLTITTEFSPKEVKELLEKIGYKAEVLNA